VTGALVDCPAVVFFVFNRPDLTAKVLDVIRAARPRQLLVVADGPRDSRPSDAALCGETRDVLAEVDWPCEVLRKYAERNLGCGPCVSQGIDWAFTRVEEAVMIVDDGLVDLSFFRFCAEMLERYRHDSRVMHIAGTNFGAPSAAYLGYSYGFNGFSPIAGAWATWRRAWREYDYTIATWPEFRDTGMMAGLPGGRGWRRILRGMWDRAHLGLETWDHQWQYTVMSRHGLSVSPSINLLQNLGYGRDDATQTVLAGDLAELPALEITFPLRHPPIIAESPHIERHFSRQLIEHTGTAVQIFRKVVPSHRLRRTLKRGLRGAAEKAAALRRGG
jgi:hypothetical protein